MRTPGFAALTALMMLAAPLLAAEPPNWKVPDKNWVKGPVGWIMTEDEQKEFKKLHTDEERAAFAKTFWEKRDPTPGTHANEFELLFWKKVESADKAYASITRPGSLTDMGKTFLLLGPPSKSDHDARGRSIWTYEPSEATGMKAHLELHFAPNDTGPLLLDRKDLETYVAAHPDSLGIGWKIPVPVIAETPNVPSAAARKPEEDQSPESKRQIPILDAILSKGSGPTDVPFQVACDYYAAVDGTTLSVVTVEAPRDAAHGSGDVALHPFARLAPAAPDGKPVNLTGDLPFVPASTADAPPGSFVYQARHNLAPGVYRLAVVVEDKVVNGQMGVLVRTIDVPDYRPKDLGISSVSLLSNFTQVEGGLGPDEKEHGAGPYMLGSFRLVPRAAPVLQKSEALSYYYQVYNPAPDPSNGRPSLEATYSFFLKQGGAWKPFRKPIVKAQGQVELYSIDLKDLLIPNMPLPAEFKLEIKVADKIAGKELKREVAFTVR